MKRLSMILLATVMLFSILALPAFAAGPEFVDENNDGICDHRSEESGVCLRENGGRFWCDGRNGERIGGQHRHHPRGNCFTDENSDGVCDNRNNNFIDEDNDGICDNRNGTFIDEDNDGICDNRGENVCTGNGQDNKNGHGDRHSQGSGNGSGNGNGAGRRKGRNQ